MSLEATDSAAHAVGSALAGAPVEELVRVGGGRNSRVYRMVAGGTPYALKQYPSRLDDPRDRQGTEATALEWMASYALPMVPRLVAVDREANHSLLSWADGALVTTVGEADIDQAIDFLGRLHGLRTTPAFAPDRLATEACLSGAEIARQIRARVASLAALPDEPGLRTFLESEFVPALDDLLEAAQQELARSGQSFDAELPQARRSLAPSDFGFHNALRDGNGRLTFIDFEYFGWDDPVKLTADILLHPGTPVSEALRLRFRAAAERLYGNDLGFAARLKAYYPLFGLRWVLILLNEFHPERWRRRQLAGAAGDWGEAKARQLVAARDLLTRMTRVRTTA